VCFFFQQISESEGRNYARLAKSVVFQIEFYEPKNNCSWMKTDEKNAMIVHKWMNAITSKQ